MRHTHTKIGNSINRINDVVILPQHHNLGINVFAGASYHQTLSYTGTTNTEPYRHLTSCVCMCMCMCVCVCVCVCVASSTNPVLSDLPDGDLGRHRTQQVSRVINQDAD